GSQHLLSFVTRVASSIAAGDEPVCGLAGTSSRRSRRNIEGRGKDREAWNGPTVIALLGKELGAVIQNQSTENKDGKSTPGGKVYTRHGRCSTPRHRENGRTDQPYRTGCSRADDARRTSCG